MNIAINNKGEVIYKGKRFISPNTFKNNNPINTIVPRINPVTFIIALPITVLIYILYDVTDVFILI